jgi:hypothetical protein
MNDLIDAIDEYNAAVDLRDDPIVIPAMQPVIEVLVSSHLRKFERLLEECDE